MKRLVAVAVLVGWTALWLPGGVRGFTVACAAAASEVSDPCALGRGLWTVGHLGAWLLLALPLLAYLLRGALRR